MHKSKLIMAAIIVTTQAPVAGAEVQLSQAGAASSFIVGTAARIDYRNATAMPLPLAAPPLSGSQPSGGGNYESPSFVPGALGNGVKHPLVLPQAKSPQAASSIEPFEVGTSNLVFTTMRAAANGDATQNYFPFSATGKLFFNINGASKVCTASLIRSGLVVTAAHCVALYGSNQIYSGWTFVPAYDNGNAPYGTWSAAVITILTSYLNGTDSCSTKGVVCRDDIALITLAPQAGAYPGTNTGWYGYGTGGYGFVGGKAQITQLGYSTALDSGETMERTDALGAVNSKASNATEIGSLQTNGSSGGPFLVNFGLPPTLSGTSHGKSPSPDILVGVTSYGSPNDAYKRQGASSFTSSNIVVLVNAACGKTPGAC